MRLLKRSAAALFVVLMMFTLGLWQNNSAEAAANITWTTSKVTLSKGRCTVEGYFTNHGDMTGKVSRLKLVVYTWDERTGTDIYSVTFTYEPQNNVGIVKAYEQVSAKAWVDDANCPDFGGEYGRYRVIPTVYME